MRRGQRFESARRLSFLPLPKRKTRHKRSSLFIVGALYTNVYTNAAEVR